MASNTKLATTRSITQSTGNETKLMQEPEKISRPNNPLKQIGAGLFALLLLWLAFRDANLTELWRYSRQINILPAALLLVSGLLSHFLRAYRWTYLLKPLSDNKVSLFNSFYAVMIGYAVNVAIPRGGEVARLISICKSDKLPWAGVLSTMLIDRMLDLALLVFLLGSCLLVLPENLAASMPWLKPGGLSLLIGTMVGLVVLPNVGTILKKLLNLDFTRQKLPENLRQKLSELAEQFDTGTKSLKNPLLYPVITLLSLAIWFMYWFNFYLIVWAFNLQNQISPLQCLVVFTIGSVGVLIPTPGSVGSFDYMGKQALIMTANIGADQALAFATVLHFLAFVVVTCVPAALLFFFKRFLDGKKETAQ